MTNMEIYTATLRLINEISDVDRSSDYQDRAPYILANFITDNVALNRQYCQLMGILPRNVAVRTHMALAEEFPLADVFFIPAEYYLAYLLLADENPELSDMFFDRFCLSIASILAKIPATREKIVNAYPN